MYCGLENTDKSNLKVSQGDFWNLEVTESLLACKATEIRSEKSTSLHQSWTPYGSGVFTWKYICLSRVLSLCLLWNFYSFPSIAPKYFLFPSAGWPKKLILVMREFSLEESENFIFFFFLILSALKCHLSCAFWGH